jgi:hypothetical protein
LAGSEPQNIEGKLLHTKFLPAGHVFSVIQYSSFKTCEIDGWRWIRGFWHPQRASLLTDSYLLSAR